MKKHIHTVHEGHKDYECESCDKSFSDAQNLKKHTHTVHKGHKDYKCDSCEKLFSRGDGLKKHIDGVHKGHKNATNYKSTFDLSWTIACLSTKFILTRQLH